MNFKTTYILFGVLGAMILLLALSLWNGPLPGDTSKDVFPSAKDALNPVKTDKITEVVIDWDQSDKDKSGQEHWVFVRDADNNWTITEPRPLRANSVAINGLIDQVLGAERVKSPEKPDKLADWGLETPKEVITLKREKGAPLVLKVGDTNGPGMSAVTYVLSSDRPREPLIVKKTQLDKVTQDLVAYRDRDLLTSKEGDIQAVTISEVDNGTEKLGPVELVKRNDRWYYEKPSKGDADREGDSGGTAQAGQPPSGIQSLLNDLTNLRVEKDPDFFANDVSDMAKYNLGDKADVLKIQIKRVDTITKTTNKDGEKTEPEITTTPITLLVGVGKKVDDKSDQYYAQRADEKDVVRVSAKNVDPLRKLLEQPDALRDRHLVRLESFKQPDAVDIDLKAGGGLLEFRHPEGGKPWQYYRGAKEEKADELMIKGVLSKLTDRNKDISFIKADGVKDAEAELAKPAAVISVWVEGLTKEEKKDAKKDEKKDEKKDGKPEEKKDAKPTLKAPAKPTFRLTFAKRKDNAKDVVVKREGEGEETTLLRVPAVIYDSVTQEPLAYLDKTLPHFDGGLGDKDVVKLVYEEGGVTKEVTRDKPENPWKIAKPADLAGRDADPLTVSMMLNTLQHLKAQKLIAEEPKKEDLEKYGLKTPSAKAVVTVKKDGKDTNYEFDFGKKDGSAFYAKQSQGGLIFTVDESELSSFKDPLLDKTVFHIDPTKLKSIKLTGWFNLLKKPTTITLEHKDGKSWSSPDFKDLDVTKMNALVNELSNLRVEKFLSHKSQPKPEQELQVDRGALRIEITVDGEKEPLVLTLGKLEMDGYVATSSKLPGDIFILSKRPFEGVMSKPAFFSP